MNVTGIFVYHVFSLFVILYQHLGVKQRLLGVKLEAKTKKWGSIQLNPAIEINERK